MANIELAPVDVDRRRALHVQGVGELLVHRESIGGRLREHVGLEFREIEAEIFRVALEVALLEVLAVREHLLVHLPELALLLRGKAGTLEGNRFRAEFERVARHAGVQLSINVVVNGKREIAGIFAGDIEAAHRAGAQFASEVYATPLPEEPFDVVILNAYPKDDELLQAENALMFHHTTPASYLKDDAVMLMASACSLGMGHHGLFGPQQRLYRTPMKKGFLGNRLLAAFMPGVTSEEFYKIYWEGYPHFRAWEEALAFLRERYPNGANMGVLPWGSIQIAV